MIEFNDRRSVTMRTKDMGLMTVTRRPKGAVVRHEASGQEQHAPDFDKAVESMRGGSPAGYRK